MYQVEYAEDERWKVIEQTGKIYADPGDDVHLWLYNGLC